MSGKLTNLFSAQDMTQGSPAANLLRFSVPLLIGNLAQQLYSTVDSIVIGAYVGDGALAAVGASGPILNLLLVLFMGISVGASVMVSQYFGAKDRDRLEATVGTTITATIASSIFIMNRWSSDHPSSDDRLRHSGGNSRDVLHLPCDPLWRHYRLRIL